MDNFKEFPISALNYLASKVKAVAAAEAYEVHKEVNALSTSLRRLIMQKQDTLTFDSTPTAGSANPVTSDGIKTAIDESTAIFYVPVKFGTSGFELDGVTHADILAAYNAGKRIISRCYVPQAAGLGAWGEFLIPMTCLQDDSTFTIVFLSGIKSVEAQIRSDDVIVCNIYDLQDVSNRVTSMSASSTDTQYPTAKAVYTAIEAVKKMYVVEFVVSITSSGMSASLLSDITYNDVLNAYEANNHVVCILDIPVIAGERAGKYLAPLVKKMTDGSLFFALSLSDRLMYVSLATDGKVTWGETSFEQQANKTTAISSASTNAQYPSAKAVYDAIQNVNTGFANGESDMYT